MAYSPRALRNPRESLLGAKRNLDVGPTVAAYSAEKYGVSGSAFLQRFIRQRCSGAIEGCAANQLFPNLDAQIEFPGDGGQYASGLCGDLRADSVARKRGDRDHQALTRFSNREMSSA